MAGALTQKDVTGLQGELFGGAGRRLALILRLKKPEPDTGPARKELKQKRNDARMTSDYCTMAECDIALGMDGEKAWKKAGDRYMLDGRAVEARDCYVTAGRTDLLKKKNYLKTRVERAREDCDFETAAIFEIALGADKASTWKRVGDYYSSRSMYSTAARCYKNGGFEQEAEEAGGLAVAKKEGAQRTGTPIPPEDAPRDYAYKSTPL